MTIERYIPHVRHPVTNVYTGGQPAVGSLPELKRLGIKTVINLLSASENAGRDEAKECAQAGLNYVAIPIDGPAGLTADAAKKLWQSMTDSHGEVLVHCGTGNRCGALLALAQAWHGGISKEVAIDNGKQAGLTGLEPVVRHLLQTPSSSA